MNSGLAVGRGGMSRKIVEMVFCFVVSLIACVLKDRLVEVAIAYLSRKIAN